MPQLWQELLPPGQPEQAPAGLPEHSDPHLSAMSVLDEPEGQFKAPPAAQAQSQTEHGHQHSTVTTFVLTFVGFSLVYIINDLYLFGISFPHAHVLFQPFLRRNKLCVLNACGPRVFGDLLY